MICPNCQMNIKDGSDFCIHCGFKVPNVQPTPTVSNPVPTPSIQNTTPTVSNLNNNVPKKEVEKEVVYTHSSKILVSLPALGIILIYFLGICLLSMQIYTIVLLVVKFSTLADTFDLSPLFSKGMLKYWGADLLLIISFILTVLHKKYMGFVSIVFAIILIIYDIVKMHAAVMPIIVGIILILCSIFYLTEEKDW